MQLTPRQENTSKQNEEHVWQQNLAFFVSVSIDDPEKKNTIEEIELCIDKLEQSFTETIRLYRERIKIVRKTEV